ncbi:SSU ribosomal protein S12P methylthiotransferase [Eubacterium aggregans]|uniref:Ribosomal protein uS12 methylthiotransferase RimO n=1 Tax=Eubacterium aggregans TaxID=81409 RepID=A0A1H3ZPT5_9FIRM|nr:30S ribosomal protein S12 methylthiotransferase RimO [Eubacterium aggregans]SEA25759.1 SSU ribosomal protein S12P methylthiotransferase [Eubacterium aggregans]
MPKPTQSVYIETLGCDKNTVDSQTMLATLRGARYTVAKAPEDADIIIINTCCFIEAAKAESIDRIFEYLPYKTEGKCGIFVVAGCMAQRYAQELKTELPEVDFYLGVNNLEDLLSLIDGSRQTNTLIEEEDKTYKEAVVERWVEDGDVTAYLKISEGCDKHCTYCAIPRIRGHYRSRRPEAILSEAKSLRDQGVEELILIAQDLTQYGSDLEEGVTLATLLKELAEAVDFKWIRLLYLYPEGIDGELLEVVRTHNNICHYFDMPIQHTEDSVLKRMGRQIDRQTIFEKVAMIRKALPDVVLRTTIITGFPGETEEEFEAMLAALSELGFERLGAFAYSLEEGTPAAKMVNQLPGEVKEARRRRIYEQQEDITALKNQEMVGKTIEVLVEETDGDEVFYGRTYGDAPEIDCGVIIEDADLVCGTFYPVSVTNSIGYDVIGSIRT